MASFFWRQRSGIGAFALAAGTAVVAAALQLALAPWVGVRIPYLFFLPAMAVVAAMAGRGPGMLVLVVGALNAWLVVPSLAGQWRDTPGERVAMAAYLVVGLVLVLFGGRVRLMSRRAAEAEQRLRVAQDDTGIGVFEIDFGTKTVFASPVMAQLLGKPPAQGRMSLERWVAMLPPDEVEKGSRFLRQKLAEGAEAYEREHRILLGDGRERWLMSRVHIERGRDGHALRVRGASVDITARKETDVLLRRTQDELRQQVADLQRLHDVSSRLPELPALPSQLALILGALCDVHGTPLGMVWLLSRDGGRLCVEASRGYDEDTLARLRDVHPGEGASGLACLERRRVVVADTDTDPRFAAFRWLSQARGFRAIHSTPMISLTGEVIGAISVHLPEPRHPTERELSLADIYARKAAVFAERARAAASAEEAEHRFQVALESSSVPFALMQPVRDTSGVIVDFRWEYLNDAAARMLQRPVSELIGRQVGHVLPGGWDMADLFHACVEAADRQQPRELTVHVVPGGGGTIAAASDGLGLGSRFTVRLRLTAGSGQAAVPPPVHERQGVPTQRILVADDNRDAADSLAALLRISGHEVRVVYDGEAALAEFDRLHPHVALLDIGMPRRSGYEVASAIRRAAVNGSDTMLVAITGWGQDRDRSTAIAAGFDHHLTKPVDPDRVQELIARHAVRESGAIR